MKSAPLPANELLRLQSLRLLNILDTEVEARYDELTALAAKICDVPICLISLVDEERQWFKSHHGLDVRETPREIAFCSHAILGDDIMEINDSRQDVRFHDNPLVTELPHVIFYAGMPLKDSDANNLGTLCLIGQQPKVLNDEQREILRVIARQVMTQFELRRSLKTTDALRNGAEQLAKAKSTFMANISHEIRSPIQGIKGVTDLLKNSVLADRQSRLLDILQDSSDTLEQLNRDISDLALIEAGRMKVMSEPYDFNEMLAQLVADRETWFCARGNRLRLKIDPKLNRMFFGDANRVRQVLEELLRHANRVTCDGELRVDARTDDKEDGNMILRVTLRDQGPCLPTTVTANLFQRFEQVKACEAAELASTGIGLAIAYELTRLMGGDLSVQAGESTGNVFSLSIDMIAA